MNLTAMARGAAVALLAAGVALGCTAPASANVYASALKPLAPDTFSFILNQDATAGVTMEVWQVGGGMVYSENLGILGKGTHTWTWNGTGAVPGNTYRARVVASSTGFAGWTKISQDSMSTSFYVPAGVSVFKDMNSPKFGTIYVSNAQGGTTAFGRPTTSGIYALNADGSEIGFFTGGKDWGAAGNSSPFKSTIGPDGHLYVADFSNDLVWEFNDDLSSVTQLIDASNKTANQYVESVWVEGTRADCNRKIYLVDSNYYGGAKGRKGLIMYDLGANATATPGDLGTQYIGPDYFAFYPRDVERDSAGNWYMNQYRASANQAPAITKFLDGTPPINTPAWETDITKYVYAYGISLYEPAGWVAYGHFNTGEVFIFDMNTGAFIDSFDAGSRIRDIAFDAAGNLYTVDNITEWLRIWSPAGPNTFTTESWFEIVPEPASVLALGAGLVSLLGLRRRKA